ncbi:sensor histidine kinase [Spirosoma luteum]|uniref:sensor histidine kinase n=1 Tax=Spirosoma luteum TaxID=431553 RepID=UPI00037638A8|nr:HAMP domain-containing sensor histidine kinase [Spirosoma luteum]
MNIRTRLTLLFVLLVSSIMLLFCVSVYYLYGQFREQEFRQRLEERASTTVRLRDDMGDVPQRDLQSVSMVNQQVTIYDSLGTVLYRQNNQQASFPVPASFLAKISSKSSPYIRIGDVEAVGYQYVNSHRNKKTLLVVASANDQYGFTKLDRLREILLFGWVMSMFIVGIAGYLFATDALRPIAELSTQVNAISVTNIHQRLQVGRQRDELADLGKTFNKLLNRLEEAFVLQKSFVSHASHELRTPLTVMMGQIEVTRLQRRTPEEYELAFDGLLDEVKNMIRLANGLLELAQVNSDAVTSRYQPVRIDELLWQAQGHILNAKPAYQITIDFANLPTQEEELVILGEASLLQTAFQNLMENGCKYSIDGRVAVQLLFERGRIQLAFSDHGYGIPDDDLPHIFEPFYRSDSTMTINGHGIGLALTRRIIELHQGHINVESEVGQGTTFWITLPTPYHSLSPSGEQDERVGNLPTP